MKRCKASIQDPEVKCDSHINRVRNLACKVPIVYQSIDKKRQENICKAKGGRDFMGSAKRMIIAYVVAFSFE